MSAVALPPLIYRVRDDVFNTGMTCGAYGIRISNQPFDNTLPTLFHNALDFIMKNCRGSQPYWVGFRD